MEFGIMFANTGRGASADGATAIAQAAEGGGFSTLWVVEHVVVPAGYESEYPYDASGKMPGGRDDFDIPDPLIWLSYVAARTSTIRLGTGILIASQRNPLITAKEVATLDQLSGGRVTLGVGAGWLREEFEALGVPFATRGRRLDEYIEAMRALWRDDAASFHGEFVDFSDCILRPQPVDRSVPIVIGGHSAAAARRAGRLGDGFYPGSPVPAQTKALIDLMRATAEEAGRDPDSITLYAMTGGAGDKLYARIEALGELGITETILSPMAPDQLLEVGSDLVARFG